MAWSEQHREAEAFAQLDFAADRDVNFIDTVVLDRVDSGNHRVLSEANDLLLDTKRVARDDSE